MWPTRFSARLGTMTIVHRMRSAPRPVRSAVAAGITAAALAGCGGGSEAAKTSAPVPPEIQRAMDVKAADFPSAGGRTLQQVAETATPGPQVGLASSVFTPGVNRLAFGLIDQQQGFVYAPSAVYVARAPNAPAQGPYPAPADPMLVRGPYQSKTSSADPNALKAVYAAAVPLRAPGRYAVLVLSRKGGALLGATTSIAAARATRIPAVGQRPPAIATPTKASVGGDLAKIDTRNPHDDMHQVSFKDVLGRRPVVLLFSTPALCQSRVCGPVTDIAAQLQAAYGDRVTFIHQEVYRDNQQSKGLRPQLDAFGLRTEPWLFAVNRQGRIVARLEGAFGIDAFRAAVERAERG